MTDISGIFSISSSTNPQWISLCGHLEAVIGNYLLSQAGNPEAYWYAIYYDSSVAVSYTHLTLPTTPYV